MTDVQRFFLFISGPELSTSESWGSLCGSDSHIFDELTRDKIPFYMLTKNSINRYSDMSDFIQSNNETTPEKAFIKEVMGTGGLTHGYNRKRNHKTTPQ